MLPDVSVLVSNIAIANCFKTGRYYGCDGGITNFKSSQHRGIQLSNYSDKANCCSRKRLRFREGVKKVGK